MATSKTLVATPAAAISFTAKLTHWDILFCALALATLALSAFTSLKLFHSFPHSHDENAYVFQAQAFAQGKLSVPFDNQRYWPLLDWWVSPRAGRAYAKYAPGFPALLSVGVAVNRPDLVNPVIAALALLFIFLSCRLLVGARLALGAITLLATNTYFLGYASSFHTQPTALFLVSFAVWGATRIAAGEKKETDLLLVGAAVGSLFLTRQLDGFCLALAALALLRPGVKWRWLFLPVAAAVLLLFTYNFLQAGRFGPAAFPVADLEFKLIDSAAATPWANLKAVAVEYAQGIFKHLWPLLTRFFLGPLGLTLPLLALFGFSSVKDKGYRRFLIAFPVALALLYNFHHTWGWPQYGARYYYPALACLLPFAAFGLRKLFEGKPERLSPVLFLAVTVNLAAHSERLSDYSLRFEWLERIRQTIHSTCPAPSVVQLLPQGWGRKHPWVFPEDFMRNQVNPDGRFYTRTDEATRALKKAFPQLPVCYFSFKNQL